MTNAIVTSFIDGQPADTASDTLIPVINPADETVIARLAEADAAQVDRAVAAARGAFPAWASMGTNRRNAILYAVHAHLAAHAEELATLEVSTTGQTLTSVRQHAMRAADNFRMFAEVASTLAGETYSQTENYLSYVTREPKGIGALIAPWNAPLALASMRIATCIAFGNSCVLKPSEYTPLSMFRMVELMHEAGLPRGVVNLVNGRGGVTGDALVRHRDIDMVGFTGGSTTGRAIMAAAASNLKPAILELGGKSANIVFADADLDAALDAALVSSYANNGQQCFAGSRILVQRLIADRFIADFVDRTRAIRVGHPLDPATEIGPLAFAAHRDRVLSFVDVARDDGAELLTGGNRSAGYERGYYIDPIAVLAPNIAARICQEEIFGPFTTFLIFDELDDAIRIANDSDYGLVAYAWTTSLANAMRCSREIRAGTIWINTPMMRELRAPFGGYKQSGIGRDGAQSSAAFFAEYKTTSIPLGGLTLPRLGLGVDGGLDPGLGEARRSAR